MKASEKLMRKVWSADDQKLELTRILNGALLTIYSGRPRKNILDEPKKRNKILVSTAIAASQTRSGAAIQPFTIEKQSGKATFFRIVCEDDMIFAGTVGAPLSGSDLTLNNAVLYANEPITLDIFNISLQ